MPTFFIPGPTAVAPEILTAMAQPMIGHRGEAYARLHGDVIQRLKTLFGWQDHHVFLVTASASGMMEGAVRNVVHKKLMHTVCGAFSKKWSEISQANGKKVIEVEVPWGKAIKPETITPLLKTQKPEAIAFTFCETSTGVLNPIPELCKTVKKLSPDTLILVDAVSAFGGAPLDVKACGIDVFLFGVQKCFALPPGLTLAVVSPRALKKSLQIKNKGYYFNFEEFAQFNLRNNTPATPAISLIYALQVQLQRIAAEGLQKRLDRHQIMANQVAEWAQKNHFTFFSEEGFRSPTVSVLNIRPDLTVEILTKGMKEKGFTISAGYGPLKKDTFRIGHMGEHTPKSVATLLSALTDLISKPLILNPYNHENPSHMFPSSPHHSTTRTTLFRHCKTQTPGSRTSHPHPRIQHPDCAQ